MHPFGVRIDQSRKTVGVCTLQFRQSPVFHYQRNNRMCVYKFLQHLFGCRELPCGGSFRLCVSNYLQTSEKNLTKLPRRRNVELLSCQIIYLAFQFTLPFSQLCRKLFQCVGIYLHSTLFHCKQDIYKRHFNLIEELVKFVFPKFGISNIPQSENNIGSFTNKVSFLSFEV